MDETPHPALSSKEREKKKKSFLFLEYMSLLHCLIALLLAQLTD
jgi:hypothetical protein